MTVEALEVKDAPVEEVLARCLEGTGFTFRIEDNVVVIAAGTQAEQEAGTVVIRGKVTDTRKQPVPGVTVIIQGTTLGTTTGEDGTFALEIPEREGITLCVSSHRAEHYWFMNGGRTFDSDVNDPAYDDFYGPAVYNDDLKDACPRDLYSVTIDSPRMREHCENWLARCAELVDSYRPAMVYFDWWIANEAFRPYLKKFAAYYYNRAEEWGKAVTICYKHNTFPTDAATFDVERGQLSGIRMRPWQTDTAIAVNSWGYTKHNEFKRAEDIVADLVDIVSKNGCLMLNVGPKSDGTICEEEAAVLRKIGAWMKVNGEAIYSTHAWKVFGEGPTAIPEGQFTDTGRAPFTPEDVRYTCKGGFLYAFILSAKGGITGAALRSLAGGAVPGESVLVESAEVLGFDADVTLNAGKDALRLSFSRPIVSDYPVCVKMKLR